ncbi:uncharacterized protein LOC100166606 precursor [Acyrthosiphon pisum]|uniref:ACYPI007464 protein n=1 Tax=Acyrthosiphon pisum TaxID=7029 RepID=C4WWM8_ACYPI|nr:uncharacterized protein LOC100166606 precursor [Acyrthosiphon pisum]BAH72298.1 ACYPI007464 [Acyrthosiphon pisum]|eukprot:NP_001280438.1 uncharacterized protein LOC100166606 precursor [Acyrthosiphon pisum]
MKVFCAVAFLLAVVAAASSTEVQKSTAVPSPVQSPTTYPGPGGVPYPAQSYQYTSEYAGPVAKSSFGPKAAVPSSAFAAYQPYQQHQQYNFGPQPQYYPGSGYPAAGQYPTPYSGHPSTGAAYPTPYSAYPYSAQPYSAQPYSAQPYNGGSYYPYPAAFPSYYDGQFGLPSAAGPYNSHYSGAVAPTVTPYSAAYPQQPLQHSSLFYNSGAAAGQQYGLSPQYPSQQYQSFYANSPAAPATASTASDSVSKTEKK